MTAVLRWLKKLSLLLTQCQQKLSIMSFTETDSLRLTGSFIGLCFIATIVGTVTAKKNKGCVCPDET